MMRDMANLESDKQFSAARGGGGGEEIERENSNRPLARFPEISATRREKKKKEGEKGGGGEGRAVCSSFPLSFQQANFCRKQKGEKLEMRKEEGEEEKKEEKANLRNFRGYFLEFSGEIIEWERGGGGGKLFPKEKIA